MPTEAIWVPQEDREGMSAFELAEQHRLDIDKRVRHENRLDDRDYSPNRPGPDSSSEDLSDGDDDPLTDIEGDDATVDILSGTDDDDDEYSYDSE